MLSILALAGCATQTFNLHEDVAENVANESTHHFLISGLGQKKIINAAEVCGGAENVMKVETEYDVLDNVFAFITFGIYTPTTARVYCSK